KARAPRGCGAPSPIEAAWSRRRSIPAGRARACNPPFLRSDLNWISAPWTTGSRSFSRLAQTTLASLKATNACPQRPAETQAKQPSCEEDPTTREWDLGPGRLRLAGLDDFEAVVEDLEGLRSGHPAAEPDEAQRERVGQRRAAGERR